jgi:hypothetical protein
MRIYRGNDEQYAMAMEGGSAERTALARLQGWGGQRRFGNRRAQMLHHLFKKAAAGNQQALSRLQSIQQKLQAKGNAGDVQARSMASRIQTKLAQIVSNPNSNYRPSYQSPYQPAYLTAPTATVAPPVLAPAPLQTTNSYQYAQPYYDDSGFVSDERRAESANTLSCGEDVSHPEYRMLIMKMAIKLANGARPSTQHFAAAKKAIDQALGKARRGIKIPGAQPGRRTI